MKSDILQRRNSTLMTWSFMNVDNPCPTSATITGQKEDLYVRQVTMEIESVASLVPVTIELFNSQRSLHPKTHAAISAHFQRLSNAHGFERILEKELQEETYPALHLCRMHVSLEQGEIGELAVKHFLRLMHAISAYSHEGFWPAPDIEKKTFVLVACQTTRGNPTWMTYGEYLAFKHYGGRYRFQQ